MAYKVTRFSVIPTEKGIEAPIKEAYSEDAKGNKIDEDKFAVKKDISKKKLFLQEIKDKGEITEKELLLVKRRLNDGTYDSKEVYDTLIGDDGLKLTQEQQDKGKTWLYNKGFTSKGETRENSPFGYREEEIMKNYSGIRLKDFYDAGHVGFKNYVPLYEVEGNDTSFEYYVTGGEISIVG
jgi:hypothetical protein